MSFLTAKPRMVLRHMCRDIHVARKLIRGACGDDHLNVTLSDATTLTKADHMDYRITRFDPGGAARTLTLPTESSMDGYMGLMVNAADEDEALTVNEDAGETEIAKVEQNESCLLFCDGTSWWGDILSKSGIT